MRHRRRKRFEHVIPKPSVVIEPVEEKPVEVSVEGLEPSRAKERPPYEATVEDNELVEDLTEEILEVMGLDFEVRYDHADYQRVFIDLAKGQAGSLIGKHGAGIEAVEHLLARMVTHQAGHLVPVQVDVNEYRGRHEEDLRELARECAARVLETGQDETLEPMHARDRRVVHLAIEPIEGVNTYTLGEGGQKRIVIHREGDEGETHQDSDM